MTYPTRPLPAHRLSDPDAADGDPLGLLDNLGPALARVGALAALTEVSLDRLNDELSPDDLRRALQSLRLEVIDAQALLGAWCAAARMKEASDGEA